MAAKASAGSATAQPRHAVRRGTVFTFGQGTVVMGHGGADKEEICPFPREVRGLPRPAVAVAAGERCAGAVLDDGSLWLWGSGRGGRLASGSERDSPMPCRVDFGAAAARVLGVSIGEAHLGAVVADTAGAECGRVYLWGSNSCAALGALAAGSVVATPLLARNEAGEPLPLARQVVCGYRSTMVLTADGTVLACGDNAHGRLGLGESAPASVARFTAILASCFADVPVVFVALGSLYAAAITETGVLYTWGYGAHGNLGHGDREDRATPTEVRALHRVPMARVHCAVGQIKVAPPRGCAGLEGPHTFAVAADGAVYSFGTAHKGVLGNLAHKALAPDADELLPYRLGDALRDTDAAVTTAARARNGAARGRGSRGSGCRRAGRASTVPKAAARSAGLGAKSGGASTCESGSVSLEERAVAEAHAQAHDGDGLVAVVAHAPGRPSGYLDGAVGIDARAAAIHSAVLTADGRLFCFGCGSGGRLGLERFEYGLHGARDRNKCYVFTPTAVEAFVKRGVRVRAFDTARRMMIAIGDPGDAERRTTEQR